MVVGDTLRLLPPTISALLDDLLAALDIPCTVNLSQIVRTFYRIRLNSETYSSVPYSRVKKETATALCVDLAKNYSKSCAAN